MKSTHKDCPCENCDRKSRRGRQRYGTHPRGVIPCTSTGVGLHSLSKHKGSVVHGRNETRTSAGDTGPVDSAYAGAWARTWLGHLRTDPADFEKSAASAARIALPSAAPSRTPRLDQSALEYFGE